MDYDRIYDKEDIKKILEERKEEDYDALNAWKKVQRQHTKEGKDYKNRTKNFINARLIASGTEETLRVSYFNKNNGYRSAEIFTTINSQDLDKNDPNYKVVANGFYINFPLSIDKIFQEIEKEKQRLIGNIELINKELEFLDESFDFIDGKIQEIKNFLKKPIFEQKINNISYRNTLHYALLYYLKNKLY